MESQCWTSAQDPPSVVVYGEDRATEDQLVIPWTVSVASGYSLLRDPQYNKGLAFTEKERDAHYLRGLLPPTVSTQQLQIYLLISMRVIRQYQVPLQKYVAMMDLQKYGSIFRRPQGLYISLKERGKILEVLKNWPERSIQVIVLTDGEWILGLGDLGCQCLPITMDVGTNNEKLLNDEFYIGLRQKRATGQEYYDLMHEFMTAVKQNYGENVLVQFEDFANHNAFELLAKYGTTHLVFNDDIQGTASVVLAGVVAALKLIGGTLPEHTFLFLGAGEAGTGIAELIALEMSKQTKAPIEETRKKIWLVDSKVIKPTVLIGSLGVGRTFTKEVVEAMTSNNDKPLIMALSNPTSQSECTAEEAYQWSEGRAIFASGSPFDPVEYKGKVYASGQAMLNHKQCFDVLLVNCTAESLAKQVSEENYKNGLIYPPFSNIRKISANIAANVAAKAYKLGLATRLPRPQNLVKYAESCMYTATIGE
ncbi:NADP-dependent malic enzyme [Glycine soja]|nr:NADP-dependent malic enzyme [Glycine soja]